MRDEQYTNDLIVEVQKKLPDYIRALGREISASNMFNCVLPDRHNNQDKNMSAGMKENEDGTYVWNCFGCKSSGSIYHMAHFIEGLPIHGKGFIGTTVELAERFSISVDYEKIGFANDGFKAEEYTLSEMYKEIVNYIDINGHAVDCLTSGKFGRTYTQEHAEKVASTCTMGCVDNDQLTEHLRGKFGDDIRKLPFFKGKDKGGEDTLDKLVFGNNILTITLNTMYGRPMSFFGRLSQEFIDSASEKKRKLPKYKWADGTAGRKDEILFLFDKARGDIKRERSSYVVEGSFDAMSMRAAGIPNVVASMGSHVGHNVADSLSTLNVDEVTFAMDGDAAGYAAVKKALRILRSYDMVSSIVEIPQGKDPDTLVVEGNLDIFKDKQDAIAYILDKDPIFIMKDKNHDVVYDDMISFVADTTDSTARQRKYAAIIAEKCSYAHQDVFADIEKWTIKRETKSSKATSIWSKVTRAEELPILDRAIALKQAGTEYMELAADSSSGILRDTWEYHQAIVNKEESLPSILQTGHQLYDMATQTLCGTLTIVGGWPSNGKSSWQRYTTLQMARMDPDLYVLYLSLDDPVAKTMSTMDALITGMAIESVEQSIEDGTYADRAEVRSAYDELKDLYLNRLSIRGLDTCPSVAAIRKNIEVVRNTLSNKKLKIVIDAMNNLSDVSGQDQRVSIENVVRDIKAMAVEYEAHIDLITHLTKNDKPGTRPNLSHLKGTSFLEFEAKNVIMIHMDMRYNPDSQVRWKTKGGAVYPIIEANVAKDKGRKPGGIIPFKFNPLMGTCVEPSGENEHREIMSNIYSSMGKSSGGSDSGNAENSTFL